MRPALLVFSCLVGLAALACGSSDDSPAAVASVADAGAVAEGGDPATTVPPEVRPHGGVDPACLENGYARFDNDVLAVVPTVTGASLLLRDQTATVDGAGKVTLGAAKKNLFYGLRAHDPIVRVDDGHILAYFLGDLKTLAPNGDVLATVPESAIGFAPSHLAPSATGTVAVAIEKPTRTTARLLFRRFTAAGAVDTAWGTNGGVTGPEDDTWDRIDGAALAPDGAIWVAGGGGGILEQRVARLSATAVVDGSFGTGGHLTVPGNGVAFGDLVPTADGGALVVTAGGALPVVVKITSAGKLDPTFGTGGQVKFSQPGISPGATASFDIVRMLVTPEGRILLVMTYGLDAKDDAQDEKRIYVFSILPSGAIDDGFGEHGVLRVSLADGERLSTLVGHPSAALLPNGRLLVVGTTPKAAGAVNPPGAAVCLAL